MREINTDNFKDSIAKGITVVDFWAPWCGPCRLIAPALEELATEMTSVNFAKLNVDENPEIAMLYSVMSIPTIIIFKDGKNVDLNIGVIPKKKIKKKIEKYL